MSLKTKSRILRGTSTAQDPERAAIELREAIYQTDAALGLFFCSPAYDLAGLGRELARQFGDTPLIGCTTAGEITSRGYLDHSITGASLPSSSFAAATLLIEDLREFEVGKASLICPPLLHNVRAVPNGMPCQDVFGLILIDGLSLREELVVSSLYSGLSDIPLFGGSAGDGLNFNSTHVYFDGVFRSDSAVFTLIRTGHPFTVFKTQHFAAADTRMVVTGADVSLRKVTELNGVPAAEEYARIVGVPEGELGPMVFATHPALVRIGGEYYVRSILKANDDKSLTFLCAIDQGLVLTLGKSQDLANDVRRVFQDIREKVGPPQLVIGCDCFLRYLEMQRAGIVDEIGDIFLDNNVVGFSTYGEQFNAMHINQTFTGVAIGTGDVGDA